MSIILYYPTIDIPNNTWLRRALLYWDQVSSIIPQNWDGDYLINLSPEIRYLIEEEQFRPTQPENLFNYGNWDVLQKFQQEFQEVVLSQHFNWYIQRYCTSIVNRDRHVRRKFNLDARIHVNKVSNYLYEFLEERGLARRDGNYNNWFCFEKNAALLYMSLLAKYLANIDGENVTIGTDRSVYERFNFKRVVNGQGLPVIDFCLNNILPTPAGNISFEKIIDFKRKREDNLKHFKLLLSDLYMKISKSTTNLEAKSIVEDFSTNLEIGIKDLKEVLDDSKINYGFTTLKSLLNWNSPPVLATVGSLINAQCNFINISLPLNIVGIAAVGSIEIVSRYIEMRNECETRLRESPFSYLYYANKYGLFDKRGY